MQIKSGVKMTGLVPQLLVGLMALKEEYDKLGVEVVITSGTDGRHSVGSKHYAGAALDVRTRTLKDPDITGPQIVHRLRGKLGPDFDILFEGDHIHVEYDPKRPEGV